MSQGVGGGVSSRSILPTVGYTSDGDTGMCVPLFGGGVEGVLIYSVTMSRMLCPSFQTLIIFQIQISNCRYPVS